MKYFWYNHKINSKLPEKVKFIQEIFLLNRIFIRIKIKESYKPDSNNDKIIDYKSLANTTHTFNLCVTV